jgi:hypothetical protein
MKPGVVKWRTTFVRMARPADHDHGKQPTQQLSKNTQLAS